MAKCGFCHVATGHNRRTCEKIYALREAGHSVKSNQTIEDFADFFNDDSDFTTESSDESPEVMDEEKTSSVKTGQQPQIPDPSDNPLNVPASSTARSPSPIISRSLDDLAADADLFDDSLGSISSFSTPASSSARTPRHIQVRPPAQHNLRAPAEFMPRGIPDANRLPYVPPHLRPNLRSPTLLTTPRAPCRPLQCTSTDPPRSTARPVSSQQLLSQRPRGISTFNRSLRPVRRSDPTYAATNPASAASTPMRSTPRAGAPVVPASSASIGAQKIRQFAADIAPRNRVELPPRSPTLPATPTSSRVPTASPLGSTPVDDDKWYWVVRKGLEPGTYPSWELVRPHVEGVSRAEHKKIRGCFCSCLLVVYFVFFSLLLFSFQEKAGGRECIFCCCLFVCVCVCVCVCASFGNNKPLCFCFCFCLCFIFVFALVCLCFTLFFSLLLF